MECLKYKKFIYPKLEQCVLNFKWCSITISNDCVLRPVISPTSDVQLNFRVGFIGWDIAHWWSLCRSSIREYRYCYKYPSNRVGHTTRLYDENLTRVAPVHQIAKMHTQQGISPIAQWCMRQSRLELYPTYFTFDSDYYDALTPHHANLHHQS